MFFIGIDYFSVLLGRGIALLSLEKTFFVLFFFLFFEGIHMKKYHNKYLMTLWIFFSILIYNLFVSQIQATLIVKNEVRIETFQQLINNKDIKIFVDKNSYPHRIIERVKNKFFIELQLNLTFNHTIFVGF